MTQIPAIYGTAEYGNSKYGVLLFNKTGTARILISDSFNKTGNSRIKIDDNETVYDGNARIKINNSQITKGSNARIKIVSELTKTGTARIKASKSIDKTGNAYIELATGTIIKNGTARIRIIQSLDKEANAKVIFQEIVEKGANSRIKIIEQITKTGTAKVIFQKELTKDSNARIKLIKELAKDSNARIKLISELTKDSDARIKIVNSVQKDASAKLLIKANASGSTTDAFFDTLTAFLPTPDMVSPVFFEIDSFTTSIFIGSENTLYTEIFISSFNTNIVMDRIFKQDDTATPLYATLKDNNGVVDLSGATDVKLYMKARDGSLKIDGETMSFEDKSNGEVKYQWKTEDVDTAGVYQLEIVVFWGTKRQTFPNSGYMTLTIAERIE